MQDGGYSSAQFNHGVCFERSEGVKQEHRKAAYYYKMAADQGYSGVEEAMNRVTVYLAKPQPDLTH